MAATKNTAWSQGYWPRPSSVKGFVGILRSFLEVQQIARHERKGSQSVIVIERIHQLLEGIPFKLYWNRSVGFRSFLDWCVSRFCFSQVKCILISDDKPTRYNYWTTLNQSVASSASASFFPRFEGGVDDEETYAMYVHFRVQVQSY